MKERINKLYTPDELMEVMEKLDKIYHSYFESNYQRSLTNYILTELHAAGYRIVKT